MRYLLFLLCLAAYGQHTINTSQDYKGVQDFSAVTRMMPVIKASDPATCVAGEFYWQSTSTTFRYCSATNTWTELGGGTGSESTSVSNTGTGAAVLKAASNVAARKIAGSAGITVTENTDDITVAPTLLTTKGDLFTYSTANARLPIGTNTYVLTADSAEATGMKWAAPAGGGASQIMSAQLGAAIAQGTYFYASNGYSGTTESSAQMSMPRAGTIGKLYVHISTAQPASHSLTCNVRIAAAASAWGTAGTPDTAVQVVIAASSAAGVYSDTSGTVAFSAGDKFTIGCQQQAGTVSSATVRMVSWEVN